MNRDEIISRLVSTGGFEVRNLPVGETWPGLSWDDAPFALGVYTDYTPNGTWEPIWGLDSHMTIEQALNDYDYLEEAAILHLRNEIAAGHLSIDEDDFAQYLGLSKDWDWNEVLSGDFQFNIVFDAVQHGLR